MNALAEADVSLSSYGLLIVDAKSFALDFYQLHHSYVKREWNKVTYSLVRHAITISDFIVWMESIPSQIVSIYHTDLSGLS